jgi:hypothetical protein
MDFLELFFDNADQVESIEFDTIEGGIEVDTGIHEVMETADEDQILVSLNRMTDDIDESSLESAYDYFKEANFDQDQFNGVISNLKGVHGELEVLQELKMRPDFEANYVIPASTSHEAVDIYGVDENGKILEKYQVKMSLDKSYINNALEELPEDVKIICPTEIASEFDSDRIVDLNVSLHSVEADIDDIVTVLSEQEPWENELGEGFDAWLNRDFKFDMGLV